MNSVQILIKLQKKKFEIFGAWHIFHSETEKIPTVTDTFRYADTNKNWELIEEPRIPIIKKWIIQIEEEMYAASTLRNSKLKV